jgi:hypothetical protein
LGHCTVIGDASFSLPASFSSTSIALNYSIVANKTECHREKLKRNNAFARSVKNFSRRFSHCRARISRRCYEHMEVDREQVEVDRPDRDRIGDDPSYFP